MLKEIMFLGLVSSSLFALPPNINQENDTIKNGIEFFQDIDKGVIQAKQENKKILVFASKENCSFCKKSEEVLFAPEIRMMVNQKFVLVKLKKGDPFLTGDFKPLGYPSFYIIDENKKLIDETSGYQDQDVFKIFLDR